MDATPMTVWLVARRNGQRLEMEGDASLLGDLLRTLKQEPDDRTEDARLDRLHGEAAHAQ